VKPTYKKAYGVTPGSTDHDHMRNLGIIRDDNTMFHDACDAAKSNRIRVQAGKGSKPRPVNKQEYDSNFQAINWHRN
jgi:hypothetical protein